MKKVKLGALFALVGLIVSFSACSKTLPEASAFAASLTEPDSSETSVSEIPVTSEEFPADSAGMESEKGSRTGDQLEELEIHFLDVGQGDCTLLLCGGEAMLIDAGDNSQGTRVQNYLQKRDVNTLKYVVCTHPDEDHIGGMDVILYKFNCETVFMTAEEKDTSTYRDVTDTMEYRNYHRTEPVAGQEYVLGDASFIILGPAEIGSESNNNSIALLLTHGSNRFLFTGDAEEAEEAQMLDSRIPLAADVYKAGHHGSRTSSSQEFLDAVEPSCVVISCGENNSYGHPHAETMNRLRVMGIQVFRTDEQGSIVLTSDGSEIVWNCSPSDTWQAGEPVGGAEAAFTGNSADSFKEQSSASQSASESEMKEPEADPSETVSYICNTNTKKFHYPDCSSVQKMKEKNKLSTNETREALINQGYVPCKICNP